jgi:hypothetical protein
VSGWLNIVRQVYQAGGKMPTVRVVEHRVVQLQAVRGHPTLAVW